MTLLIFGLFVLIYWAIGVILLVRLWTVDGDMNLWEFSVVFIGTWVAWPILVLDALSYGGPVIFKKRGKKFKVTMAEIGGSDEIY